MNRRSFLKRAAALTGLILVNPVEFAHAIIPKNSVPIVFHHSALTAKELTINNSYIKIQMHHAAKQMADAIDQHVLKLMKE